MDIILEEFSGVIAIPFIVAIIAMFGHILNEVVEMGIIYSIG